MTEERATGSATSRSSPGRRRGPSATTRRSGCSPPSEEREPGAHRTYGERGPRAAPGAAPPARAARRLARGAPRAGGRRERPRLAAAGVAGGDRGSRPAARGAGRVARAHRLPARPAATAAATRSRSSPGELEARRRRVRDRLRSVNARQLGRLISPSITGITPPPTRGRPSTISTSSTLGRPISSPCLITDALASRRWREVGAQRTGRRPGRGVLAHLDHGAGERSGPAPPAVLVAPRRGRSRRSPAGAASRERRRWLE